jgi:uncharacterized membrane protein
VKLQFTSEKFGQWAEAFARFFGTPTFIIGQTVLVILWIGINCFDKVTFDPYPFILLNLAFSTQAAYAAPLILLAQSRQTDRDKAWAEADALHREEVSQSLLKRQKTATEADKKVMTLIEEQYRQNLLLIELTQRIEVLTKEIHTKLH